MSVCDGNEWQVGHIGLSDKYHKYWILCLIIAKSENHTAAGLLLKRATQLLRDAGGDGRCVLVDGGKALDKAVRKENEKRVDQVKHTCVGSGPVITISAQEPEREEVANLDGELVQSELQEEEGSPETVNVDGELVQSELQEEEGSPDTVNIGGELVQAVDSAQEYVFSEAEDAIFEKTVEAFAGQQASDTGDMLGRMDLEERLKILLESVKLGLERCLAHMTRNAGSRGGGWIGGKGSLCRDLLNCGCSKKDMQKVSSYIDSD